MNCKVQIKGAWYTIDLSSIPALSPDPFYLWVLSNSQRAIAWTPDPPVISDLAEPLMIVHSTQLVFELGPQTSLLRYIQSFFI